MVQGLGTVITGTQGDSLLIQQGCRIKCGNAIQRKGKASFSLR